MKAHQFVGLLLWGHQFMAYSQAPPNISIHSCYGGSAEDLPTDILPLADGDLVLVGQTKSNDGNVSGNHGDFDGWWAHINSDGSVIHQKTFGGSAYDDIRSIDQDSDGEFILLGQTGSTDGDVSLNHGAMDIRLLKITSDGSIQWQRSWGGSSDDIPHKVLATNDGGYVFLGYSYSNDGDLAALSSSSGSWLVKVNSSGGLVWHRRYQGVLSNIAEVSNTGYLLVGSRGSIVDPAVSDATILRVSQDGDSLWQHDYGGNDADMFTEIEVASNGDFWVSGNTRSSDNNVVGQHGGTDIWVCRFSSAGDLLWQRSLGGSGEETCYGMSLTSYQAALIMGFSFDSSDGDLADNLGAWGAWIVQLSPDGELIWQRIINGTVGLRIWQNQTSYGAIGYRAHLKNT